MRVVSIVVLIASAAAVKLSQSEPKALQHALFQESSKIESKMSSPI